MKRPWLIWLVYGLCLAVMLPSLGWLTHLAIRLDRDDSLARAVAQQEQDVREALLRMDATLTPILAPEAARPFIVYRSFYDFPAARTPGTKMRQIPSPLLTQSSDMVLLHFQVDPDGTITSPQCPPAEFLSEAVAQGVPAAQMTQCRTLLAELKRTIHRDELLKLLPQQELSPVVGQVVYDSAPSASPARSRTSTPTKRTRAAGQPGEQVTQLAPVQQQSVPQQAITQQILQNGQQSQIKGQSRDVKGFETRNQVLQDLVQSYPRSQSDGTTLAWGTPSFDGTTQAWGTPSAGILEGDAVSRAFWIGSHLMLARRTRMGGQVFVQGCWLDWPRLSLLLREQVAEFLPSIDFQPVASGREIFSGRELAALPVELIIPAAVPAVEGLSLIRVALVVAWVCVLAAAAAFAILLAGMLRLSARQTEFVTAVTHELRTPLTTFRLYAELLADEMLPSPEQRRSYLETLRIEADRLSHLVSNVLAYARLDGGRRCTRTTVVVREFVERIEGRLRERAALAGMELAVELEPPFGALPAPESQRSESHASDICLRTDPLVLEQILFNLVDNAAKYAVDATDRRIHLQVERSAGQIVFRVRDHGPGIARPQGSRLFRPFSKTAEEAAVSAPGIGLGLALCRRLATDLGGELTYEATYRSGASFRLSLPT